MMVELVPATIADKSILRHLLELCLHDYSEFNGEDVDEHGLFGYLYLDNYWTEAGRHAFLIKIGGKLAGFALVRQHESTPEGQSINAMAEFLVLRKYRKVGIGARAACMIFDRFPGLWRVGQEKDNHPAQAFWRKVIGDYSGGTYREIQVGYWPGPTQEFSSPGRQPPSWQVSGPHLGQGKDCEAVLRLLPDWFGIESAIVQYGKDVDDLPTWTARDNSGRLLGFLAVRQHSQYTAEITVMGVRPETHHNGIGRVLLEHAEVHLRGEQVEYLQVKTVGPSCDDPFYARTRGFYLAAGFRPLEELKQLWNEENPCLIFVKRL
jgi:predicted acetyltransferase/N-acetylglutamate synthase-like GNAT family acetyltransferase